MGAVDHRLVRPGPAGKARDHVVADDLAVIHRIVGREARALQRDRVEARALGGALLPFEVQAGLAKQLHRQIALDPALDQGVGLGRVGAHDVELGDGVGVLHRRPAVGGGRGLVHDQHAERALARGLLVLVGPAAVVGHRAAAETARPAGGLWRFEVGVVDQHHSDLAVQVHALEIVPAALRRPHAVADEDERCMGHRHMVDREQGLDHGLVTLGQGLGRAAGGQAHPHRAPHREPRQRHVLQPAAVLAPGLDAGGGELTGDVVDGLGLARRGRPATLEGVRRQHPHMFRQPPRVHRRGGQGALREGVGSARNHGAGGDGGEESGFHQRFPASGPTVRRS